MNTSSMIRIVISSLLMAIFSQTCPAQVAVEIKGTVRSVTGESLPGATVIVEGTARGVITDVEGRFTLKARKGQMLKVSFVGMKPRLIKASSGIMNIILQDNVQEIEGVVVTGYQGGNTLSASQFLVNDPGSNTVTNLQQFLNKYPNFYKIMSYK